MGTWFWSASTGRFTLDEGAAEVLAGDGALAGLTLTPEAARARVIPTDRIRHARRFGLITRLGGPFGAEYRTVSATGESRSIVERGRVFQDDRRKPTHGMGIVIDTTEPALHEAALAQAVLAQAPVVSREDALDQAVSSAMSCRQAIDRVANSELRLLVDMLLLRLGQEVARHT
ncbi:PAS domain-containing protein [Methylobacterium sp. sgz302541]|uniref:PAS domain-containing protein n=1 Tax=unclassified Methylobacterium TaxID=2615210 RepID=UPI003D33BD38